MKKKDIQKSKQDKKKEMVKINIKNNEFIEYEKKFIDELRAVVQEIVQKSGKKFISKTQLGMADVQRILDIFKKKKETIIKQVKNDVLIADVTIVKKQNYTDQRRLEDQAFYFHALEYAQEQKGCNIHKEARMLCERLIEIFEKYNIDYNNFAIINPILTHIHDMLTNGGTSADSVYTPIHPLAYEDILVPPFAPSEASKNIIKKKRVEKFANGIASELLWQNVMFMLTNISQIFAKNRDNNYININDELKNETPVMDAKKIKKYDIIKIKNCECTGFNRHDKIGIVINTDNDRIDCLLLNSKNQYDTYPNMLDEKYNAISVKNDDIGLSRIELTTEQEIDSNFTHDKGISYISQDTYNLTENDRKCGNIYLCGELDPIKQSHRDLINKIKHALQCDVNKYYDDESYDAERQIKYSELLEHIEDFDKTQKNKFLNMDEKKKKKKRKHKKKNDNNNIQEEDQKEENSEVKNEINDGNQLDDVMEKENNNNITTLTSKNMVGNQTQKEENSETKNEINDGNQLADVTEKENNNNIPTLTSKNMASDQTLAKK